MRTTTAAIPENHFATIESAEEYVGKLDETLIETKADIETEMETLDKRTRRYNGLMIAHYKLVLLERHLKQGHKLLHDLRKLDELTK